MLTINKLKKIILIALLVSISWTIVYYTGGTSKVYVYIFFVPIILSSLYWGIKGGFVVGLICGIFAGPLMPLEVYLGIQQNFLNWFIRVIVFILFGLFISSLFKSLKDKNQEIVRQNEELKKDNITITTQRDEIVQQHSEIERQKQEIENIGTEIILCLAEAIEVRDAFTFGHCKRVAQMAYEIGKRLGLDNEELLHLRWSGLVHDVGKIGIPESILNKSDELTSYEYSIIQQHPDLGETILKSTRYAEKIIDGVLCHHERLDGKGYPNQLTEEQISLQARIIAVSDVWDAITSDRPYRDSIQYNKAINIMEKGRGTQFDPKILDVFMDIVKEQQDERSRLA